MFRKPKTTPSESGSMISLTSLRDSAIICFNRPIKSTMGPAVGLLKIPPWLGLQHLSLPSNKLHIWVFPFIHGFLDMVRSVLSSLALFRAMLLPPWLNWSFINISFRSSLIFRLDRPARACGRHIRDRICSPYFQKLSSNSEFLLVLCAPFYSSSNHHFPISSPPIIFQIWQSLYVITVICFSSRELAFIPVAVV